MNLQPSVSWNDFGNSLLQGVIGGVGSGLLGLGFNALSGLVDNSFYKDQADYAFQLQEKAAKNAYNRQLDFWNLQNLYNDPSNQVNRLKGAGLSPALMNGQAMNNVAGGLSSTPIPGMISPQSRQSSASNFIGTLTTALAELEQVGFLDAETKLMWQKVLNEKLQEDIFKGARDLGIENLEKAKIDREAYFEALYDVGLDGGVPRVKNNPYKADIENARMDTAYKKALSESEDALRDARKALAEAETEEARNAAKDHLRSSELKVIQKACLISDENRKKSLFPGDLEAQRLENNIKRYAKDIAASDSDLKKLDDYIKQLWSDPDRKLTWEDAGLLSLDFIHNNLNLSGSKTWK